MSTLLAAWRPETADPPKRWTTAEFDRLIGQGVLEEGSDTYLWEGQIVEPRPEYQPHYNAIANVSDLLRAAFPAGVWLVNQDAPLDLEDGSKPQPDLLVTRGPRSRYQVHAPVPADVALLIEVSVSTYPRGSGERYRKYARVGIPRYWIVNVPERRVEVYETPHVSDGGKPCCQKRAYFGLDQMVPLNVTHEQASVVGEIAVMDMLRDSLERAEDQG